MRKMDWVRRKTLMGTALVVLVGLLVGCGGSSVRLGWVETSSPGHIKASYSEFTGTEIRTIQAQAGNTLYLRYDAEVDRGRLQVEVDDPFGETVWCASLCRDCGETKALPVDEAGCYTILVRGEATAGGFDLAWGRR